MQKLESTMLFGVTFYDSNPEEAAELVTVRVAKGLATSIAFTNPEFIVEAQKNLMLREYLSNLDFNFADGTGIVWADQIFGDGILKKRCTGTDFFPFLCRACEEKKLRLYLYGAEVEVNKKVVLLLREQYPELEVDGCHGYIPNNDVINSINAFEPDILVVCLGNPLQENWIMNNSYALNNVRCMFGAGGLLDHMANKFRRAPRYWQNYGFEWLWRLGQDFNKRRILRIANLFKFICLLPFLKTPKT